MEYCEYLSMSFMSFSSISKYIIPSWKIALMFVSDFISNSIFPWAYVYSLKIHSGPGLNNSKYKIRQRTV